MGMMKLFLSSEKLNRDEERISERTRFKTKKEVKNRVSPAWDKESSQRSVE